MTISTFIRHSWRYLFTLLIPTSALAQPLLLDPDFNVGSGFTGGPLSGLVNSIAVQADGRVVAGGWFLDYDGVTVNRIARLLPTGERDTSFHTGTGFDGPVDLVALQPDGKILVSGSFGNYNGQARDYFVRLLPNGDLDTTFTPFTGFDAFYSGVIEDLVLLPDGSFIGCGGAGVLKFQANGVLDQAFQFDGTSGLVWNIALRPDGRLLAVGDIMRDENNEVIGVGQFLANGSLDPGFILPPGILGEMRDLTIRPDGIALVAGPQMGGPDRLLALQDDGSLLPGFDLSAYQFSGVRELVCEPNGHVLVGLGSANGPTFHQGMCRVRQTGVIDPDLDADASSVSSIVPTADGGLYIAGGFTSVLGVGRPRMARVQRTGLSLQLKAFLGGAWLGGGLMSNALTQQNLVPLTEPYTALGYAQAGGGGGETTTLGVLQAGGDNDVTDWVLIEVRSGTVPTTVLASQSALVQVDGDVVAANGSPVVSLPLPPGNYHIVLLHRNHLGVMTAGITPTVAPGTTIPIDLSLTTTATFGSNALRNIGGTMVLWPGDVNTNGNVAYTGSGNDRDPILVMVGGTTPNNVVNGVYSSRDTNLNGSVSYVGLNNDRDPVLFTVGSTTPNNTRAAQLP